MIALDELLIKIGIDGEQAKQINTYVNLLQMGADKIGANTALINEQLDGLINDVSQSLDNASKSSKKATEELNKAGQQADKAGSKFSKLKLAMVALVGGAMLFGNKIASAFNSAVGNAETLFKSKNALYSISKAEIEQVEQYKKSLDKTALSINSIKTKIAINLIPTVTAVSNKFNGWLVTNKDLVTNGISKVIEWLGKGVQVVTNFIKFVDKVVRSTIGWKNAFIALGIAWAILNRAFLFSPIGMLIVAFGALLLLVDDLMVYMAGGKSLFGSYWDPIIDGAKSAIEWFNSLSEKSKKLLGASGILSVLMIAFSGTTVKVIGIFIKGFKMMAVAVRVLTAVMMSNPILAILSAIAIAAYLIYDNWEWLKNKFKGIWNSIGNFAKDAWKSIVDSVSNAVKEVLMYFGMTEDEADIAVEEMKKSFAKIMGYITQPFKDAFNFIKDLFKIWGDENSTFTEKVDKTFSKVKDLITAPFKAAMKWVDDTFMVHIRGALGWVEKGLSKIGIDVDLVGKEPAEQRDFRSTYFDPSLASPNVPSPNNSDNRVTNHVKTETNVTVNVKDAQTGAREVGKMYTENAERANDLINNGRFKS